MKFSTKLMRHYPSHLRHVATLPWEIINSNFLQILSRYGRKCKQIVTFSVFEIARFSIYWLQINFSCHCSFTYLLSWSICGTGNSSQQTSLFDNNQHGTQWWGQDFHKKYVFEWVHSKEVDRRISRKAGQSVVLISCSKGCGIQVELTLT